MLQLAISESFRTVDDLTVAVERIVDMIGEGYTSGYDPHWTLIGEAEQETDDERDHRETLPGQPGHEDISYKFAGDE